MRFLIIFDIIEFHFIVGPTNYVAGSGLGMSHVIVGRRALQVEDSVTTTEMNKDQKTSQLGWGRQEAVPRRKNLSPLKLVKMERGRAGKRRGPLGRFLLTHTLLVRVKEKTLQALKNLITNPWAL